MALHLRRPLLAALPPRRLSSRLPSLPSSSVVASSPPPLWWRSALARRRIHAAALSVARPDPPLTRRRDFRSMVGSSKEEAKMRNKPKGEHCSRHGDIYPYYMTANNFIVIYDGFGPLWLSEDIDKEKLLQYLHRMAEEYIVLHSSHHSHNRVIYDNLLPDSRHHDGSIYKIGTDIWKQEFRIADHGETWLEPMMLSDRTTECIPDPTTCITHMTDSMLQIFSLKLAEVNVGVGSLELYGYVAVRDVSDPLRNYIVNCSRDDPIIVEQGSFIEITGPKRGIYSNNDAILEFDLKIKRRDQEDDQLIDGATDIEERIKPKRLVTRRIKGDCGAVDITFAHVTDAVEATVQLFMLEVQCGFNLSVTSSVSGFYDDFRLFEGAIAEPCELRYVVAVAMDTPMELELKLVKKGSDSISLHRLSFKPDKHGCSGDNSINDVLGRMMVKVNWSTLPWGPNLTKS